MDSREINFECFQCTGTQNKSTGSGWLSLSRIGLLLGIAVIVPGVPACHTQEMPRHISVNELVRDSAGALSHDIEHGISDVNSLGTALNYTVDPNHFVDRDQQEAIVKLLVEHGAVVDVKTMRDGGATCNPRIMKLLLDHGGAASNGDVLGQAVFACCNKCAGQMVSKTEAEETVRMLLDRGAYFDIKRVVGQTALEVALQNRYSGMARLLVEHGADANATEDDGTTALMSAAWSGSLDDVRLLVHAGAAVKARSKAGRTALMEATTAWGQNDYGWVYPQERRGLDIAALLLKQGASVNAHDQAGRTALMEATASNDLKMMQLLLKHGADPNARDAGGDTVLALTESPEAARLLLASGAHSRPSEAVPFIHDISPASQNLQGGIGGANMQVSPNARTFVLTGSHFQRGAVVCVDGRAIATKFVSTRRLEADTSVVVGAAAHQGNLSITVRNPGENRRRSNPVDFWYRIEVMAG